MSKRSTEIEQLAYQLDMQFYPTDEWGMLNLIKDFRLCKRGRRKRISNIMMRTDTMLDDKISIFDYHYTVNAGKHAKRHKQTVLFIQSKQLGLPQFSMKPENFLHTIGAWLGFEDIDFENYPEFSENYYLKGEDEDYIRYSLNDQFLKYFTIEKDWSLEGVNYYMLFYKKDKILKPREVKELHHRGMKVYEMLKIVK